MNTREIAKEYRLSHWAAVIRERQESGLSIKEYCERAGFHSKSYFYWQKKLREAACEGFAGTRSEAASLMSPVFAEVKLPERSAQAHVVGNLRDKVCIEVTGMRLTAGCEYPIEKLAGLLRGLGESCC